MKRKRPFPQPTFPPVLPGGIRIVYDDHDLLVVEKPAGLLTMGTATEKRRTVYAILFDRLRRRRPPEPLFIVHRLDREASGLLVFAKSEAAKHRLQEQFKDHSAGRTYTAVVEGLLADDSTTIQSWLAENAIHRCYSTPNRAIGKWAVTHVRVLRRGTARTLVEVRLETGRKHQIRVHLAERGHPIVGDPVYGSGRNPIRRLALHGMRLAFTHPFSGKAMSFEFPPPDSFLLVLK